MEVHRIGSRKFKKYISDGFLVEKEANSFIKNEVKIQEKGNMVGRVRRIKEIQNNY